MYYFDNVTLKQYLDTKLKLSVYVDDGWYYIADMYDLSDDVNGIGYNVHGQEHIFDYRSIEKIKVGNKVFTVDQLNAQFGNQPQQSPEPKKTTGGDEEEPVEDEKTMDEPKKEPQKSHYDPYMIGVNILKEWEKRRARN